MNEYELNPNGTTTVEVDEESGAITVNVPNRRIARLVQLGLHAERAERKRRERRRHERASRRRNRTRSK